MYAIELSKDLGITAEQMAAPLAERGIATRPFFLGLHEQPIFHQMGLYIGEHYPVAERIARQGLYLPSGLALTDEQIRHVCESVKIVIGDLKTRGQ